MVVVCPAAARLDSRSSAGKVYFKAIFIIANVAVALAETNLNFLLTQ
jgi:hypothetical protein